MMKIQRRSFRMAMGMAALPVMIAWAAAPPAMAGEAGRETRAWTPATSGVAIGDGVSTGASGGGDFQVRSGSEPVVPVLLDTSPGRTPGPYVVRGEVRWQDVGGDGFLEMWSVFPPADPGGPSARYFSRTLGTGGPMGTFTGSGGWRDFMLPFQSSGTMVPERLELNVVLPDGGEVWLRGLTLSPWDGRSLVPRTLQLLNLFGAVLGCMMGLAGALIGFGSSSERRHAIARAGIGLMAMAALLSVAAAVYAGSRSVWSLAALYAGGVILAGFLAFQARGRLALIRRESELRRMRAADA